MFLCELINIMLDHLLGMYTSKAIIFVLSKKKKKKAIIFVEYIKNINFISGYIQNKLTGKKKKKPCLYIYNFYFEYLIYKWIKQFDN